MSFPSNDPHLQQLQALQTATSRAESLIASCQELIKALDEDTQRQKQRITEMQLDLASLQTSRDMLDVVMDTLFTERGYMDTHGQFWPHQRYAWALFNDNWHALVPVNDACFPVVPLKFKDFQAHLEPTSALTPFILISDGPTLEDRLRASNDARPQVVRFLMLFDFSQDTAIPL